MTREKNTPETDSTSPPNRREAHLAGIRRGLITSAIILTIAWIVHEKPDRETPTPREDTATKEQTRGMGDTEDKDGLRQQTQNLRAAKTEMIVYIVVENDMDNPLLSDLQKSIAPFARQALVHPASLPSGLTLRALPGCLILGADGNELRRWEGRLPAEEIRQFLKQTTKPAAISTDPVTNTTH